MQHFIAELIGTAILIVLGDGVVANVLLNKTKGQNAGWIVITFGWGMAVFVAVLCVAPYSGAHLNPAVTFANAVANKMDWNSVPAYLEGQMAGAMLGALIVYQFYKPHFDATDDADLKLACFCTSPNIRNFPMSIFCEIVGTFLLVFPSFLMVNPDFAMDLGTMPGHKITVGLGAIGAIPVGLLVFSIGMSLGGTTGYAINPARDLGPRLVHAILPIRGKRDSDWGYAWVPVLAPLVGGVLAALAAKAMTAHWKG
ncbi:MAG TPA: MIP/aquaporin family protein [Humisphaera sp.]|nr:MIP/aquaporin family protein [Humisphaera sp.]